MVVELRCKALAAGSVEPHDYFLGSRERPLVRVDVAILVF